MTPTFDDPRLEPIREKVENGARLSFEDGVTLFRSPDLLGVGWMANRVRERLHRNTTYFNVNRHINPTDVCVASCRLCAFGKRAKDPKAYTTWLAPRTSWACIPTAPCCTAISKRKRIAWIIF